MVRAILRAQVDLLYNGGIGTYVKATVEEDAEVGDRTNDRVRVNATRAAGPRPRRGREPGPDPARAGSSSGRRAASLNTDAVDNSGGVDMSDHEVNIKILLDLLVRNGVIHGPGRAQPVPGRDDRRGLRASSWPTTRARRWR